MRKDLDRSLSFSTRNDGDACLRACRRDVATRGSGVEPVTSSRDRDSDRIRDRDRLRGNVRSVILAALSLSVALGFNNFLTSVQEHLPESKTPRSKAIFFMSLFTFVIAISVLLDADLKK